MSLFWYPGVNVVKSDNSRILVACPVPEPACNVASLHPNRASGNSGRTHACTSAAALFTAVAGVLIPPCPKARAAQSVDIVATCVQAFSNKYHTAMTHWTLAAALHRSGWVLFAAHELDAAGQALDTAGVAFWHPLRLKVSCLCAGCFTTGGWPGCWSGGWPFTCWWLPGGWLVAGWWLAGGWLVAGGCRCFCLLRRLRCHLNYRLLRCLRFHNTTLAFRADFLCPTPNQLQMKRGICLREGGAMDDSIDVLRSALGAACENRTPSERLSYELAVSSEHPAK